MMFCFATVIKFICQILIRINDAIFLYRTLNKSVICYWNKFVPFAAKNGWSFFLIKLTRIFICCRLEWKQISKEEAEKTPCGPGRFRRIIVIDPETGERKVKPAYELKKCITPCIAPPTIFKPFIPTREYKPQTKVVCPSVVRQPRYPRFARSSAYAFGGGCARAPCFRSTCVRRPCARRPRPSCARTPCFRRPSPCHRRPCLRHAAPCIRGFCLKCKV